MRLEKGQRWLCESRYCGCEIQVVASSEVEEGMNPRCSCGSVMKKLHVAPQVKSSEHVAVPPALHRKAAQGNK
jgi:hypothetical protein